MTEVLLAKQRAMIASTIIEVLRGYSLAYFGTDQLGTHIEDILIGSALIIGQAEGRPMSVTDVAEFVGMPRATVDRKIKAAVACGSLIAVRDGRRIHYSVNNSSSPEIIRQISKNIGRLKTLCQKLSKMDDSDIANALTKR